MGPPCNLGGGEETHAPAEGLSQGARCAGPEADGVPRVLGSWQSRPRVGGRLGGEGGGGAWEAFHNQVPKDRGRCHLLRAV